MDIIKRVAPAVVLLAVLSTVQVAPAQSSTLVEKYHKDSVSSRMVIPDAGSKPAPNKRAPRLCNDHVVRWLYSAGFRGQSLRVGWSIVMRESRGQNVIPGNSNWNGSDFGPWQINWPTHQQYSQAELSNPVINSRIAFKMSHGGKNWSPWGIGVSRSGKVYLDSSQYNGIWDSSTQYAWIWEPFIHWYSSFPKKCR